MKTSNFARIMIAGTGSGCGKTTVTCAILRALVNRGMKTAAFKCGPDYIDPMFHSEIIGTKSRNLDTFLCGEKVVKHLFVRNGEKAEISLLEGVMGFYDGFGNDGNHSSYSISKLTNTPVVLVIDPKGMALSVVAMIKGFMDLFRNNIKGVIINSVTPAAYTMYKYMIEDYTRLKVLGFLPPMPEVQVESRHLGLVTAQEITDIKNKIDIWAANAEKYIDLEQLLEISKSVVPLKYEPVNIKADYSCNIAVARDKAFCFYYEDNLELLQQLGAEITFFSPLKDKELPASSNGLVLGGGYPELYVEELSKNTSMRESIRTAIQNGMPTYAECGGFMYLQDSITSLVGKKYPMVGAIEGNSIMQNKLVRFGYTTLVAKHDNMFCSKGGVINAHEFHNSDSDNNGMSFESQNPNGVKKWDCIFANDTIVAGYPHMHLWGNVNYAERFIQKCFQYKFHSNK